MARILFCSSKPYDFPEPLSTVLQIEIVFFLESNYSKFKCLGPRNEEFPILFCDFGIPFGDMVHLHTVGRFWRHTCMICQVDVNARYFGTVIFYHKYRGYGLLGRDLNTS